MEDLKKLSSPFDPSEIEWFIGVMTQDKTKGLAIPFVSNRAVQNRLDEVCGVDGWRNEYNALKESDIFDRNGTITGKKFSYLCGISIWSESKSQWITKWDGAEDTDIEALKGGLSSAMKRAAVQWGIGRYLYYLDSPWVEIEKKGNSYVMKASQRLVLPQWAIPGGTGYPLATDSRRVMVQTGEAEPARGNQNSVNAPKGNTPSYTLSEKQVNRAYAKAAAANMSKEDVLLWIGKKFGVDSVEKLSRHQYDALCDALDNVRRNLG